MEATPQHLSPTQHSALHTQLCGSTLRAACVHPKNLAQLATSTKSARVRGPRARLLCICISPARGKGCASPSPLLVVASRPSNSQGIPQPATVTPVTTTTPATPANADLSLSPGFIAFLFPSSSWLALYGWVGCVYWGGLGEPAFWVTFGVPKHQRFAPKKREETSLRGDPLSLTPPPGSNL